MKATIFLRIASVLTIIHSVLHTIGGVFGKPVPGAGALAWAAMESNHFVAMGYERSYAEYFRGLGLGITVFLTAEAIVFWLLGSLAKEDSVRLRPILWVFLIGYLAFAVDSYFYFFLGPVIVEILIAFCLGMAIFTAIPKQHAS